MIVSRGMAETAVSLDKDQYSCSARERASYCGEVGEDEDADKRAKELNSLESPNSEQKDVLTSVSVPRIQPTGVVPNRLTPHKRGFILSVEVVDEWDETSVYGRV